MLKRLPILITCLLLAACGTLEISIYQTPTPDAAPQATLAALEQQNIQLAATVAALDPANLSLNLDSPSEVIRMKLLYSHTFWRNIFVDGSVTWNIPQTGSQPSQTIHEQLRIDQTIPAFQRIGGPADAPAQYFSLSDGKNILQMDLTNGLTESRPLPEFAQNTSTYAPSATISDTINPHPLSGTIGSPLSEIIFSSGFAQTEGTFKPVGIEYIAGRECLITDFTRPDLPRLSRFWVDLHTGIILKYQNFENPGEILQNEYKISYVEYDSATTDDIFNLNIPALPQYTVITGISPAPTASPAPPPSADDPLGAVYFTITDHKYGQETYKLARLPGSCVAGLVSCPTFEIMPYPITSPPEVLELFWAPDGKSAAFVAPTGPEAANIGLYLLDPGPFLAKKLTEYTIIDPPSWSPDGKWLAFRVQDGNGGEEIHAIRTDGSSLTNLTADSGLPATSRPYTINGWLGGSVLLHARGVGTGFYLYNLTTGDVRQILKNLPAEASDLYPAPNGALLAYIETNGKKSTLKTTTPDGSAQRELASFSSSNIYPIIWSPDSLHIVFGQGNSDLSGGQAIYLLSRTGEDLQKVRHSVYGNIISIQFSPDGNYLLVQDDDSIGRHLFVVNLSTLEQRKLSAPGLPLDWWWLAPSWKY